jgi:RNA 2',3'-cyclic 3'-phosphodiesterase
MSRCATARLFVAVDPPLRAREQLAEWARALAANARGSGSGMGLRLLDVQGLHLTLCFLGSRPVGEIEALADAVGACAQDACALSVGAPLWLPQRRPRALAVEIHDRSGELTRVQERISRALAHVSGWEPERRRFRPHITLARVRSSGARRRGSDRSNLDRSAHEPALAPVTPRLAFTPREIVLYRSWLSPAGASYEALARVDLAPAMR